MISLPASCRQLVVRQLVVRLVALSWIALYGQATYGANTIPTPIADGFDYPVGFPDAYGYYKARGYRPNGHLGEDWNGRGGGNTDLGDPVYAIGDGVVVYSQDYKMGWGNVVIVRHAYRSSDGRVHYIDSLYGHLNRRLVQRHQQVRRGQKVGTIGTNRGMYLAHLHFEIRKNVNIGMKRSSYARDYSSYHSPSHFIREHRNLRKEFRPHRIPVDNFHTGSKNHQSGEPLEKLPELPKFDRVASVDIDGDLRSILERHNLMRAPADKAKKAKSPPRTMFGGEIRPERKEDTPQERAERDKIRSFWSEFRNTLREPDKDDEPIPPEEDSDKGEA